MKKPHGQKLHLSHSQSGTQNADKVEGRLSSSSL